MIILAEAELPVTAIQIGVFIGCASFILSIVRNIVGIRADSTRVKQGTAETPLHLAPHQMSEMKEPALKSDMEDELEDLNQSISTLREEIGELRSHIDTRMDGINAAGEGRMSVITAHINRDITAIRQDIESRTSLIHEKINHATVRVAVNDESIGTLKIEQNSQGNQISHILQRLPKSRIP
jgi:DNA repair ATPase RecN